MAKKKDRVKEHREKVIASCDENNEIGPMEDGFQYFWGKKQYGAMSAADLRVIADELDRRNKGWEEQINRDLSRLISKEKHCG